MHDAMAMISDHTCATRLRWSAGGGGCALLHGVRVALRQPPVLAASPVYALDYVPEAGVYDIQRAPHERCTLMTAREIQDADALLRALCEPPTTP